MTISRRTLLKTSAVASVMAGIGAPLVARAQQAEFVYKFANNLPDTLFLLISGGALNLAMIPLLRQAFEREGRPGIWRLFSQIANFAFLVTAVLALGIFVFAPVLVARVVAPVVEPAMAALRRVRGAWRQALWGLPDVPPRIWST